MSNKELTVGQSYFKYQGITGVADLLVSYFPERFQSDIVKELAIVYNRFYDQLTDEEINVLESIKSLAELSTDGNHCLRNTLEEQIKSKESLLESYISGYYSPESTKERFKALPHCLEVTLLEHGIAKDQLELNIKVLKKELEDLDKELVFDENILLFK